MTPEAFIKKFEDDIIAACINTPIFPSVKMAQMAIETGWGSHLIGSANNAFGIKAAGKLTPFWNGRAVTADTTEVFNGSAGTYPQAFRVYDTIIQSIKDHSYFLLKNKRYAVAGAWEATTPLEQAVALQKAGYATDPEYSNKLINIINKYGLNRLDEKKKP